MHGRSARLRCPTPASGASGCTNASARRDSPFPGIFSSIDSYSKKVLQAALQHAQRLPHWFERFGLHGEPLPLSHHSWFKVATGHGSLQLSGTPDEILLAPDGSLIIIDYKTARYNPKDHLRPLYEVQLNVYARIAENLAPRSGYPFPCRVQTLGLMYYDPLTEVNRPDKINTRGFLMEFHAHWVPIQRRDEWIDELLARAWAILSQPSPACWQSRLQNLPSLSSHRQRAAIEQVKFRYTTRGDRLP
jgi:hypothetical protein